MDVHLFNTHMAFRPGVRCGSSFSVVKKVAGWTPAMGLRRVSNRQLFPPGPPINTLRQCLVKVAPTIAPPYVFEEKGKQLEGVDIRLIEYFARAKNVSLVVDKPRNIVGSSWRTSWEDIKKVTVISFSLVAVIAAGFNFRILTTLPSLNRRTHRLATV